MPTSQTLSHCRRALPALFITGLLAVLLAACSDPKNTTIGYIGPQAGANGALLAAEQASAAGGINGKPVKIIAINSEQPGFQATQARESLGQGDIRVIIDATGKLGREGQVKSKIAIVTTGGGLTGGLAIDNPLTSAADRMADQLWQDRIVSVSVLLDLADQTYNELWLQAFKEKYEKNRGVILKVSRLDSTQAGWENDLVKLTKRALIKETRGLVVIAEAEVAAKVCRQARLIRKKLPLALALAEPALPAAVMGLHDKNLEGVTVVKMFATETESAAYDQFVKDYRGSFGSNPNLSAASAYDAVGLIVAASGKKKKLSEGFALLTEYQGVLGTANYDANAFKRATQLGRIVAGKVGPLVPGGKKKS